VEIAAIRRLVADGEIAIAAGGGGIPVARQWDGSLHGVEAVIDKDLASSLLGRLLGCETLCIITGVDRVALNYGKPDQLSRISIARRRRNFRGMLPRVTSPREAWAPRSRPRSNSFAVAGAKL
jgi:carbamate kinase